MIKFMRPTLPLVEAWAPYLATSYKENRFSNNGPCVRLLEERFAEKFPCPGRSYILCSSATAGLAAVLMALRIKGVVVIPAFTFSATLQAVRMAECTPSIGDVSITSWDLDLDTIKRKLENLSAIVCVRPFGLCRSRQWMEYFALDAGVPVIFDSAAALGGQFEDGSYVGGQGYAEVFSLHATKVFGIGEGGLICADVQLEGKIREALNFGICGDHIHRGLNGKMSEFSAAVGLAVLDGIDTAIARRRAVAERYLYAFQNHEITPPFMPGNPVWQTYPILLNENAGPFVERCLEMGVEVRRYYRPSLSGNDGVSADLSRRMVCLPVYSDMTVEEQSEVIRVVTYCLG